MFRLLTRFRRGEAGAALVEFTILTPILLFIGGGIVEFGNALYSYHVVDTGVRDAARYVARFKVPADHYDDAKSLAITGSVGGTEQRLSWWDASSISITTSTESNSIDATTGERPYRGPDVITMIRVSTNAAYPGVGFLSYLGIGSPMTISLYHEERVINE
ncbi:MAG: TadE/TadG family type IV pilus assembly protein [Hyphomicrobiaceae bacterium]